jgi:hypothetical protein
MSEHGAHSRWKGQHSLWEETGVPGENPRVLVERPRIESAISEVKNACTDGCATEAPLAEKVLKGIEPNVSGL